MEVENTPELPAGSEPEGLTRADTHARRHGGRRWILLTAIAAVIAVPILVAGYIGLVPGLSGLMGATKPRNLGITYTAADYASYLRKTEVNFRDFAAAPENPLRPGRKTVFADPRTVHDLELTQEEITAAINTVGWAWMPVKNAQVRFGSGDTIEISGNLNIEHIGDFVRFIGGVGYSESDVDKAVSWGRKFLGDAAVYVKGQASVEKGMLNVNVDTAQVGRFTAPSDITNKVFLIGTTNATARAADFLASDVAFQDGSMLFSGTYPTTVYVRK